jgi:colicin import membrane protein
MNFLRDIVAAVVAGFRELVREPRYLIYAVLVHIAFFAMFVLGFDFQRIHRPAAPEVVQAVVVDESRVREEMERLKEAEARKAAQEAEAQRRQREAEEARKREEQRLAELKKKQQEEAKKAEEARKREEQRLAELRKQQEQAKKEAEEARKREEQRLAELKKQQEEAKKAEEARKREEQRRKEEEARRAEEARKAEEARQAELRRQQAEREAQAAAERARQQSEIDRYMLQLKSKIQKSWNKPANWRPGLECTVRVRIIPGGDVVDVSMVRSCGDPMLDRSVENAVYKAAPLPVPPADSGLFDHFREVQIVFKPES